MDGGEQKLLTQIYRKWTWGNETSGRTTPQCLDIAQHSTTSYKRRGFAQVGKLMYTTELVEKSALPIRHPR